MRFKVVLAGVAALGFLNSAYAINRNDLEIVSMVGSPIKPCHQNIAFGIDWKNEADNPSETNGNYNMSLLVRLKDSPTVLSPQCKQNPVSCLSSFGLLQMPNKRIVNVTASYPGTSFQIAAAAVTTTGDIVYSKVKEITFSASCPTSATISALAPGNGGIPNSVDLVSDRGPTGHVRKPIMPVVKWVSSPITTIGGTAYPAKFTASIMTYTKNVDTVYFEAKTGDGLSAGTIAIPGTDVKVDPETGLDTYSVEIRSDQWPAGVPGSDAKTIQVRAVVIPKVGRPVILSGPLNVDSRKTDLYSTVIYNNKNNAIVTPVTRFVSSTGTDTPNCNPASGQPCCGPQNLACQTISGAITAHQRTVNPSNTGVTNLSGLTIELLPGTSSVIGTPTENWPGYKADQYLTIKGSRNALGRIQSTITGRYDLAGAGYPDTAWLFDGNILYKHLNIKNAPGPHPIARRYILPVSGASRATEAYDVHFEGIGLDGVNPYDGTSCLGDTDGFGGTYTRVVLSSFTRFMGNGNQWAYFLSLIFNGSIPLSEVPKAGNLLIGYDQTGKHAVAPYGFPPGCVPGHEPHGDGFRLSGTPQSAYVNIFTTDEGTNRGQGAFYSSLAQLPNMEQHYSSNVNIRIAEPGVSGVGRALLAVGLNYATLVKPRLEGGPTTGRCGDNTSCPPLGVYVVDPISDYLNDLFGADGTISSDASGGNFDSNTSGYKYRSSGLACAFDIP